MTSTVADNLAAVQERIARAASQAGRSAEEITLVAVTKRQPVEAVRAAFAAGITDIGENYVQEAAAKREALGTADSNALRWHLIGHLQRNKAKQAVSCFDVVQSVDSVRLAQTLSQEAVAAGKTLPVLLQVHLGDEATKTGLPPEMVPDAAAEIAALAGLRLDGLMGIAPLDADPRDHFANLRRLWDALPPSQRQTLCMGMSGDFEAAISEGATMVRIGTAIFGLRQ